MFGVPSMCVCPALTELEAISSTAVRGKFTDSELDWNKMSLSRNFHTSNLARYSHI